MEKEVNAIKVVKVKTDSRGYMKGIITYSLWTILIFVWLISLSLAVEQPNGFMGMKWGESIEQCKKKGLFVKIRMEQGNVTMVVGKDSSIGKIGVGVHYFFYKNKLYSVFTKFLSENDFNSLILLLKEKYGEPKSTETSTNIKDQLVGMEHAWEMRDVIIGIKYNGIKKEGILYYTYKPLYEEAKSGEKGRKEIKKSL